MTVDTYKIMNIRLSREECKALEEALNIIRNINREIDECHGVDETRLSDDCDANLLNNLGNAIDELGCSIEF